MVERSLTGAANLRELLEFAFNVAKIKAVKLSFSPLEGKASITASVNSLANLASALSFVICLHLEN